MGFLAGTPNSPCTLGGSPVCNYSLHQSHFLSCLPRCTLILPTSPVAFSSGPSLHSILPFFAQPFLDCGLSDASASVLTHMARRTCYACILTLMAWLVPRLCVYVLCMYAYSYKLARASPMVHMLRMYTYSYGLARASPMYAPAMHAYPLLWLGLCLADVCMCYACIITLMAWLVPRPCVYVHACILTLLNWLMPR